MVRKLVEFAIFNPFVIFLVTFASMVVGIYSFLNVNVEAYPDPAPAIVEVYCIYPGASAEEVERQVTIPLEVCFAGMPGLKFIHSKSLFGLSDLKMNWNYGSQYTYEAARQEVINRIATNQQPLPPAAMASGGPTISPESPCGEIFRYILSVPKDDMDNDIYNTNDIKAMQDWVMERDFRPVPRVVDLTSFGGTVRRYEVQPDPDRLRRYGISLPTLQNALSNANATVGGDYVTQGPVSLTVRSLGLLGGGQDPANRVLGFESEELDQFVIIETVLADSLSGLRSQAPKKEDFKTDKEYKRALTKHRIAIRGQMARISKTLVALPVNPPLTEKERGFVKTTERLMAVQAGTMAEDKLTSDEVTLFRNAERMRERLHAGMGLRETKPALTDEEREHIRTINQRAALRAAVLLRREENNRADDIRSLVITSVNNKAIRIEDVIEGGGEGGSVSQSKPLTRKELLQEMERAADDGIAPPQLATTGVVVGNQTRLGRVGYWKADVERPSRSHLSLQDVGHDESDKVQGIVLMRKGENTLPALKDIKKKVEEVNDPGSGRRLPGVTIEPYYDREKLLHVTTETVTENLALGVLLVVTVLFMFVNNIRTALIVAINIPIALLFAFSMLYLRGKSANLLSIGAVDFGIIVDSSVIMVENIYRNLAAGQYARLSIRDRILRFVKEIDSALLFSTLIMVVAFVPLFTMSGAEGALFAPMAQTYAFSLAGALLLTLTLTPVLCMFCFKNFKPVQENLLVRMLKARYLGNLHFCLQHRFTLLTIMGIFFLGTALLLPHVGREFMPELEEGNLWIRSTGPLNQSLERNGEMAEEARAIMASFPEVDAIVTQAGRPDDGTDTEGYENTEYFVPLRPKHDWPLVVEQTGWRSIFGSRRARTKDELVAAMNEELRKKIPIVWNFSQSIRDNVMEALSGFKGDNSVKIFGPDLVKLEQIAAEVQNRLQQVKGMEDVGVIHEMGQSHLEFRVDPVKCARYGTTTADVNNVVSSALGAKALNTMYEGEKAFDIPIRWPKPLRDNETAILDVPVDIINNTVLLNQYPGTGSGTVAIPNSKGNSNPDPALAGTGANTANPISSTPRLRLRDLVSPVDEFGGPDPDGQFIRPGAAAIFREQGKRLIAVKFSVRDRDLGSAVDEAKEKTKDLFKAPYRADWAGEIEQMNDATYRLMWIIPLSLLLIFILLYIAFNSFLDATVVLSNVLDVAVGGVWALFLTGTNFSISAAVGFVSLFGIAIMDGLLMIAYFNSLRSQGLPLRQAIMEGAGKRVRPVTMTAMTAILGLLPAALSTKIGAQTARPLAIVVVGGMVTTLFLTRYLMPVLYSFYGHRTPPQGAANMAH